MEILETIPILATKDIYPILAIIFLVLGFLCGAIYNPNENKFGAIFCTICIIGVFIFFTLARTQITKVPTGRNQYLVKIDKDYPIAEVIEQYDIVEIRNADTGLYLLEDKEN